MNSPKSQRVPGGLQASRPPGCFRTVPDYCFRRRRASAARAAARPKAIGPAGTTPQANSAPDCAVTPTPATEVLGWVGHTRSWIARVAVSCSVYEPSLSGVKLGDRPSGYAYCQWRLMVTLPVGWSIAAVEPSGRSVTVQEYSMGTPLRLAKMVGTNFWPAFMVMREPADTANGAFGSRQLSGCSASITTQ